MGAESPWDSAGGRYYATASAAERRILIGLTLSGYRSHLVKACTSLTTMEVSTTFDDINT